MPRVPRATNGYREYTDAHVYQMRLGRLAMHGGWPGRPIRRSALSLVRRAASGELEAALAQAREHLMLVRAEQARADAAASYLEEWVNGRLQLRPFPPLSRKDAAAKLDVTVDALRHWERNGLIKVPRKANNNYRLYGPSEVGRLGVIRMLRQAGYSTMAILRMLTVVDRGLKRGLRNILDTPRPDEDVITASDRWLSTLAEQEGRARRIVALLRYMARAFG